MGNVHMEARQVNYRGGNKPMSVEEAIKKAGSEITPEEKTWIDSIPALTTSNAGKTDQTVIAPEFDAETGVYAVDDMVMYEGELYKFTTAHETPGAWNAEEVEATNIDMAIKGAGGGASLPDYSTTETATGQKWIDGSDIYVCVFDQGSDITIGNGSYSDTNIDASGIAKVIDARAMQANGTYKLINASCDASYVKITSPFSSDTVRYITLFYTKSA